MVYISQSDLGTSQLNFKTNKSTNKVLKKKKFFLKISLGIFLKCTANSVPVWRTRGETGGLLRGEKLSSHVLLVDLEIIGCTLKEDQPLRIV